MTTTPQERHIHQGRNIKRFREMMMMKQDALAKELGEDWTQKKVSLLEAKEEIDAALLERVAGILNIPVEAIKNYTEEAATTFFNTFNENSVNHGTFYAPNSIINPTEEWRKAMNENHKLAEENKALYERLLKAEQEKVAMLERLLQEKK